MHPLPLPNRHPLARRRLGLQGAAAGGGFALALASDVRVAERGARFSAAFVRLGLTGTDMGTSFFLPRLAGLGVTSELLMTGRQLAAERAYQVGGSGVGAALGRCRARSPGGWLPVHHPLPRLPTVCLLLFPLFACSCSHSQERTSACLFHHSPLLHPPSLRAAGPGQRAGGGTQQAGGGGATPGNRDVGLLACGATGGGGGPLMGQEQRAELECSTRRRVWRAAGWVLEQKWRYRVWAME